MLLCGSVPAPDNTWESVTTPTILRGISNVRVQKIGASVSSRHVLFVSTNGEVYAYGDNSKGQCGVDATRKVLAEPLKLVPRDFSPPLGQDERVVDAAAGAAHSLLVTSAGNVYAAGSNAQGQCGLGAVSVTTSFQRVEGMSGATQVSCGRTFSMVLASGKGTCPGLNQSIQSDPPRMDSLAQMSLERYRRRRRTLCMRRIPPLVRDGLTQSPSHYNTLYKFPVGRAMQQRTCRANAGWTVTDTYIPGAPTGLAVWDAAHSATKWRLCVYSNLCGTCEAYAGKAGRSALNG